MAENKEKLEGFGGWLVLVQIFLILSFLSTLLLAWGMNISLNGPALGMGWIILSILIPLSWAIGLFLFYTKKKSFTSVGLTCLWISYLCVIFVLDKWSFFIRPSFYISLVIMILFTFYLKKSERVKNTFVN